MTKPKNFPKRKLLRRVGALNRQAVKDLNTEKKLEPIEVARTRRTKKWRGDKGRFKL